MQQIELRTRTDRPHPSQQANSSCIENLGAMATFEWILSDYRNRYDREQATSSPTFREARWPTSAWRSECISMTTMFVHTALLF